MNVNAHPRSLSTSRGARLAWVALMTAACGSASPEGKRDLPKSTTDVPAPLDVDSAYTPRVEPTELSNAVTHRLLPYPVGAHLTYEGVTDDGHERIEVRVEAQARNVWGTQVRVVHDTAYLDEVMVEDTSDWFAQDEAGNVWYLGEDSQEYEDGRVVSKAGSWKSGVDGALRGVVMLAEPKIGDVYRQEYYLGEAEDFATVVALNESVTVPAGSFTGCVRTREQSVIDREADEFKVFCPGIGLVLETDGEARVELVGSSGL